MCVWGGKFWVMSKRTIITRTTCYKDVFALRWRVNFVYCFIFPGSKVVSDVHTGDGD